MSKRSISIGQFALQEPIGAGGMGEVWRGVHASGAEVALKLINSERLRTSRDHRENLRHEVRAMARLDHPGIVLVLDYGDVDADAAARTRGRFAEGSPYLVLELMRRGSLKSAPRPKSWDRIRDLLIALLDALAHAHARGVVHRDIKPSNILLDLDERGELVVKLSDFGIAFALDTAEAREDEPRTAGTPWYMAPEQIIGRWREQGPWTDIYSLGCVAYELANGQPPFPGKDKTAVCRSHCFDSVPPSAPQVAVPVALDDWLAIALAKRPSERFESAADAAHALLSLDVSEMRDPTAAPSAPPDDDTASLGLLRRENTTVAMAVDGGLEWLGAPDERVTTGQTRRMRMVLGRDAGTGKRAPWRPPPMPLSWRAQVTAPRRSMQLRGAGLGLYGLRPVPLAGRSVERDELWQTLREVRASSRPRVVVLEGAAGVGKSRLCDWLAERASELGAAGVMRATHNPIVTASDGVEPMLLSHMRALGLQGNELRERIAQLVGELDGVVGGQDAEQLYELFARSDGLGSGLLGLVSPAERFAVMRRYLARVCARRPLVLILDDVQWGSDALAFAQYLVRTATTAPLPVLLLLTVQDAALDDRPAAAERLDQLCEMAAARRMTVEPLDAVHHAELVQDLLGLEGEVARVVERRTAGNPLFAVQLVGDWVQRGRLVAGPEGFELRPGARAALPDDIHSLWSERIDRVLGALDEGDRPAGQSALTVASLLGRDVRFDEWRQACAELGVSVPDALLDVAATRGLCTLDRDGFTFAHGMLRESLERRCREAGTWKRCHRACAAMLVRMHADVEGAVAERVARHRLAADELELALAPLLAAAEHHLKTSDFKGAHALYALREGALAALGIADDDPRAAQGAVRRADAYAVQGDLDKAARCLDRATAVAERQSASRLRGDVLWLRGAIEQKKANVGRAEELFETARLVREGLADDLGTANCLHGIAECKKLQGSLDDAARCYRAACDRFRAGGQLLWLSRALAGLADVMRRMGRIDEALALTYEALGHQRELGNRHALGVTLNGLGDIARNRGDLEEAERHYREAVDLLVELGSEEATLIRINLALTLLAREDWVGALRVLESTRKALEQAGRGGYMAYVHAALLPCFAALEDWRRYDASFDDLGRVLVASGIVDDDLALCLEQAGELAGQRGERDRARRALELAVAQYEDLALSSPAARARLRLVAYTDPA